MGDPRPPQDRPHRLPVADPTVHRPRRRDPLRPQGQVLDVARDQQAHSFDAPGAEFDHRDGRCTFEVLIDHFGLDRDPALVRLAAIVHAADIDTELHTDPLGPGLLAIGLGGLDVEADDHRLLERASFVYDALYAWSAQQAVTASA